MVAQFSPMCPRILCGDQQLVCGTGDGYERLFLSEELLNEPLEGERWQRLEYGSHGAK